MVIHVSTVAEGIQGTEGICHRAGNRQVVTPGIVAIMDNGGSGGIQNGNDITLNVNHIVVGHIVVGHRHRNAVGAVGKVQGVIVYRHLT